MGVKWDPRDYGDPTLGELVRALPAAGVLLLIAVALLALVLIVGAAAQP